MNIQLQIRTSRSSRSTVAAVSSCARQRRSAPISIRYGSHNDYEHTVAVESERTVCRCTTKHSSSTFHQRTLTRQTSSFKSWTGTGVDDVSQAYRVHLYRIHCRTPSQNRQGRSTRLLCTRQALTDGRRPQSVGSVLCRS